MEWDPPGGIMPHLMLTPTVTYPIPHGRAGVEVEVGGWVEAEVEAWVWVEAEVGAWAEVEDVAMAGDAFSLTGIPGGNFREI